MSQWSHILGTIEISVHEENTQEQIENRVKHLIENLPKITGSERDMYIHYNENEGYNTCNFDDVELQTSYTITLKGDLRDRDVENTVNELILFLNSLSHSEDICYVEDAVIQVNGYKETHIFSFDKDESDLVNDEYVWKRFKYL